ncbi:MAG: NYN domain-containing protein [Clostridia bacterium]|nr:NYN domain-containing protein [Clostridia bacterium]
MNQDKKIALLIDAENISRNYRKIIMNELAKYGTTTYRRIYGDFTSRTISWTSEDMLKYSLTPVQQYSNTSHNNKNAGKNSSDITLVIDAMDILYSGNVEGFCIVSSDSDFTKLASRLREAGMLVIGMGEEKTPLAFRKSCEKFILLDVLSKTNDKKQSDKKADKKTDKTADKAADKADKKVEKTEKSDKQDKKKTSKKSKSPTEEQPVESIETVESNESIEEKAQTPIDTPTIMPLESITQLIKTEILPELADEEGWASLADIGNWLYKLYSDFDSRNYGFSKLSALFKSCEDFEVKPQPQTDPNSNVVYYLIREKV